VLELPVSETINRLLDPGEVAVDVGANIGHMTSIMALRVGPTGKVLAFEPHPLTFDELNANIGHWTALTGTHIHAHRIALSDSIDDGVLNVPGEDSINRAIATVSHGGSGPGARYSIRLDRLDTYLTDSEPVGLLKVDVEGHEAHVLRGAQSAIQRKRIRDIVFEEYRPYPTAATAFLEANEYTVFSLGVSLIGLAISSGPFDRPTRSGYIPTYLATSDPERALRRLRRLGWTTLRSR
jgi:FkbM family methyltransferase